MKPAIRRRINQANARISTGPVTPEGKSAASLNAFKHGLTGQRMLLQEHELEAYRRLSTALHAENAPQTETERQLVQKIVDCHARLNRIAALDGNILNVSLAENTAETCEDDRVESIVAQARAFIEQAGDFDKLGRYESRIARQLMHYTKELARVQNRRIETLVGPYPQNVQVKTAAYGQEIKSVTPELASFGNFYEPAAASMAATASVALRDTLHATEHANPQDIVHPDNG